MAYASATGRSGLTFRISSERVDFLIFALWCLVTFVQFRGDELVLYPLALYYAYSIWRYQRQIVPLLARAWVILLYPTWCLISVLWAVEPIEALKHAVYLFLTMLICFQVVSRLSPREILHAICLAAIIVGAINFAVAMSSGRTTSGIFTSKNSMGKNMVVLWIATFATFLDPGTRWHFRLVALGFAILAAVMAVLSNSATAVLLVLASALIIAAGAVILRGGLFRASRLATLCMVLAGMATLALAILPYQQVDPVNAILSQFGKDSTLTGRTLLWQYAEEQIRERPFLGVGAGGFWRYAESPLVQRIHFEFYKGPYDRFNFHNSFYEIAVHQGLIGVALASLGTLWAAVMIVRWAIREGTIPAIYFFAHGMVVLVRIATEADFLKPFVLFHMIFWIGALAAVKHAAERDGQSLSFVWSRPRPS